MVDLKSLKTMLQLTTDKQDDLLNLIIENTEQALRFKLSLTKDEKLPEITSRLNVFGTGIGMPDIHKVTSMCQQYRNEERLFLGKSVTASWCNTNFSDGSQLVRWIASWHLFHLDKNTSPKDNLLNY